MINHIGTNTIETERLLLRKFRISDSTDMLKNWIADEVVQGGYGEPVYQTYEEVAELLDRWVKNYKNGNFYRWAIILKETNENIGQIGFCRVYDKYDAVEIEYCLGQRFWGLGYATECVNAIIKYCFESIKLNEIEAFHRKKNIRSGKLLTKTIKYRTNSAYRFINKEPPDNYIFYKIDKDQYFKSV
ncbi:MAG: GNAT family N-acetyltransferase [Clostridiales bacterium]|nr:GNAT family N-acetyltransferase [Clostridiales bacterium]